MKFCLKKELQEIKSKLDEMNASGQAEILSEKKLAGMLGVTQRTLSNWRDQGKIGYSKIGGRIFYRRSDIEEALSKNYVEPFKVKKNVACL